MKFERRKTFMQ